MAPIDDELRSALTDRAELLTPSADPFAGIERKAKTIKRNRGFAAIVGTAAAVALVAVAVPAVIGGSTVTSRAPVATDGPTSAPAGDRPANALLWPQVATQPSLPALVGETQDLWAAEHQVAKGAVVGEVLFVGQTSEQRVVAVQQLWAASGDAFVVISTTGEEQPLLLLDEKADPRINGYRAIVPGRSTPFVVAIGAPTITSITYSPDGTTFLEETPGRTAVFRRSGPTTDVPDVVRFDDASGARYEQPADPSVRDDGSSDPDAVPGAPANVKGWPLRGQITEGPSLEEAKAAMAKGYGVPLAKAVFRPLFAGSSDGGLRYVYGQFWEQGGNTAYSAGYVTGGEQGPEAILQRATPGDAQVLAFVPCCSPGLTVDELVVIPAPGAGQVQYGAANSEWRDVGAGQDALDGVVIIDRDARDTDDRLRVLDGDGNLDGPFLYEGPVADLLCGVRECG